jgi:hypothetical protein
VQAPANARPTLLAHKAARPPSRTGGVVQRVLWRWSAKDETWKTIGVSSSTSKPPARKGYFDGEELDDANPFHQKYPDPLPRLLRTVDRNSEKKAKPKKKKKLFEGQKKHNYGFDDTTIDEGFLKGTFRKGQGDQPYLSVNKKNYGQAVLETDYDAMVSALEDAVQAGEGTQAEIAQAMLSWIENEDVKLSKFGNKTQRAMAQFIMLTQIIEAHAARVPGTDKLARASLRRIAMGVSTFHKEFNNVSGSFLPAWAKKAGARFGGQEAIKTVTRHNRPKSHKAQLSDTLDNDTMDTIRYMSESSGDESDSDDSDFDKLQKKLKT